MKKSPNLVDKHVGSRVRMRRMLMGMSQEKLGDALGLTFQQVQKYEKGTNRIGASRLQQIAARLEVPIDFFFAGAPAADASANPAEAPLSAPVGDLLSTTESVNLIRAFVRIKDPKVRRRLVELVNALAGEAEDTPDEAAEASAPAKATSRQRA